MFFVKGTPIEFGAPWPTEAVPKNDRPGSWRMERSRRVERSAWCPPVTACVRANAVVFGRDARAGSRSSLRVLPHRQREHHRRKHGEYHEWSLDLAQASAL